MCNKSSERVDSTCEPVFLWILELAVSGTAARDGVLNVLCRTVDESCRIDRLSDPRVCPKVAGQTSRMANMRKE